MIIQTKHNDRECIANSNDRLCLTHYQRNNTMGH